MALELNEARTFAFRHLTNAKQYERRLASRRRHRFSKPQYRQISGRRCVYADAIRPHRKYTLGQQVLMRVR